MGQVRAALIAALVYFAVVFVIAFGLGAGRTVLLEPLMSKLAATALEAPFLLSAMLWAASWIPPRFGLAGKPAALVCVGAVAFVLQQIADVALGLTLRDLTLGQQYAQFLRPEGWLFAALLGVLLFAPLAFHARRPGGR